MHACSRVDIAIQCHQMKIQLRSVSVSFNVLTTKLLNMVKFNSSYSFAVSEVKFFYHCMLNGLLHCICMRVRIINLTKINCYTATLLPSETTTTVMTTELLPPTTEQQFETKTPLSKCTSTYIPADQSVLTNQRETTTAWILFASMSILFSGSLTINVIVIAFLVYKKRQVGEEKGQRSVFEIEGNPCYEATEMKQSSESEAHVYETVREKRAK